MHSLMNQVGMTPLVVMGGGVAKNAGVVRVLGRLLETELVVPPEPQIEGVLGVALFAADKGKRNEKVSGA